jgi:hypothetical protein
LADVSVDPRFERAVVAEFALSERRGRRQDPSHGARALAQRLHRGHRDLLAHLRRVALAVPTAFRPVAWLHHAREAHATSRALLAAGLTREEVAAIDLLARAGQRPPEDSVLHRVRALSEAPGRGGYLARVIARAEIEDLLAGERAEGETLAALCLLPDPRLTR